jgi:serine/threonine protein kinase
MMYIVYETLDDRSQCRAPVGYVMELMALSAADRPDYTLDQLMNVFVQIACALASSHEHGVIHFDIKPENILLDESCSVAKLCDFGCAHKLQSAASSTAASVIKGQMRGTQLYMAPEVFRGKFENAPQLCDIFSFGKTMWKLLHPSRDVEINVVSPVDASVPLALKELIEQCLNKDPAKRPQDMIEVLERLKSACASATAFTSVKVQRRKAFSAVCLPNTQMVPISHVFFRLLLPLALQINTTFSKRRRKETWSWCGIMSLQSRRPFISTASGIG